ncbi:MAG: GYD domain-containing protein [Anaerolineales bacterium]|jgi:uncharacterized protein with GYD domain|nr:GYD domain-containing protein [Anaerolineales bacterium]
MPTFIILANWTEDGIKNIKGSPDRLDAAKQAFKDAGAELKEFYMVMGQYDMVLVTEAPNGETISKLLLAIASGGAVSTETLRAFPEDEYRKVVAGLS